jgi:hypothetical protein
MPVTNTPVRHKGVPAYFLGRPSTVYIQRYRSLGWMRRSVSG